MLHCIKKVLHLFYIPVPLNESYGMETNSIAPTSVESSSHASVSMHDHLSKKCSPKRILWKERKSLKIKIPSTNPWHVVTPFVNNVFDEFTQEVTAAIQFCIGNPQKFPDLLDYAFNETLLAEGGFHVDDMMLILKSIYKCTAKGKDFLGNQLQYNQLIHLIPKDEHNEFHGMEAVYFYIDNSWKGLCLLMVLKKNYRLYRNYKNAYIGLVTHSNSNDAAFLLAKTLGCLKSKDHMSPQIIRASIYQFKSNTNNYVEIIEIIKEYVDEMKRVLDSQEIQIIAIRRTSKDMIPRKIPASNVKGCDILNSAA